jgi:hypothetical protein
MEKPKRANEKASGVYLVAPDRETRLLGLTLLGLTLLGLTLLGLTLLGLTLLGLTLLGLTLLRLTHVAGDDAVGKGWCHQCLLNAVVHQQFKAGLVRRTSCRNADNAKLHRAHGTRRTLRVGAGQFSRRPDLD